MSILGRMIGVNDSRVLKSSFHCNSNGQIAQMSEKLHLKKRFAKGGMALKVTPSH